jgi:hypothetical protein
MKVLKFTQYWEDWYGEKKYQPGDVGIFYGWMAHYAMNKGCCIELTGEEREKFLAETQEEDNKTPAVLEQVEDAKHKRSSLTSLIKNAFNKLLSFIDSAKCIAATGIIVMAFGYCLILLCSPAALHFADLDEPTGEHKQSTLDSGLQDLASLDRRVK